MAASQTDPNVLVDALPYIDPGYDDSAREAAQALIDEECKRYRPTKDYLAYLPPVNYTAFETESMKTAYENWKQQKPKELLSMERYKLSGPPTGKLSDLPSWQEAVKNSQAQLEQQAARLANLELMQDFGPEAWKVYNGTLQAMLGKAQTELNSLKQNIQEINFERKDKQTKAGDYLKSLELSWVSLVTKNYQIEQSCAELEAELQPLRKKYKTET